ncbi:MAG TPA: RHS repeat-associated core domain-containing protein, partial [Longimicrobiaceae bacterium]|nr:RHS repeat-associated core domain-containing protein [Longimicrobiaceae bacterium]
SSECKSFVERTVWDGDQVLFEIRAPSDPGPYGVSNPESDTGGGEFPYEYAGRVAYVHAGGIDQPLEIARMDIGGSGFVVVPHATWRGIYDLMTFTGTKYAQCGPHIGYELGTQPECFPFDLQSISAFGELRPRNYDGTDAGPRSWLGSLITGSRDGSGLLFRRNRYLDPNTGRFTQEDPIGLAGGLNAYGFAEGDPITYSDPYGLSAACEPCKRILRWLDRAGERFDAAFERLEDATGVSKELAFSVLGPYEEMDERNLTALRNWVHGNSAAGTRAQHGYRIFNSRTGETIKYGISGQSLNQDGSSPRANRQVNAINRAGGTVGAEVLGRFPDRAAALKWERRMVDVFVRSSGRMPVGQRLPQPTIRR